VVEEKLEAWWSPTQISEWLIEAYPDSEGMRVSDETISQSLFVQGKGAFVRSCGAVYAPDEPRDVLKDVQHRPKARSGTWS